MDLLMLTKYFPFGTGEAFIENEIRVFSEHFEKIVLIACEVIPSAETIIRPVPDNVEVLCVPAGSRMRDVVKGILKLGTKDSDCKNIKQRIFLSYFESKSQRVFDYIVEHGYLEHLSREYVLYSYWLFMTARVGISISKIKAPVFMFTRAHRYDLYAERNELNYLPERRLLLDSYNMIFPCSDDGTVYLKKRYPEYAKKIETALLGTLEHGYGHESTDGVFRIVSCSRIAPEKRVDKIVEALTILDGKYPISWTHIGGGTGLIQLEESAKRLKMIEVDFMGDTPNTRVMEIYRNKSFDLFVNVSSSEGLPVSIMEASSFGLPSVATDVGGTAEIVVNGVTGILLREDFTKEELAVAIEKMICTDRNQYRKNCRDMWEKQFRAIENYNKFCKKIMGAIDECHNIG